MLFSASFKALPTSPVGRATVDSEAVQAYWQQWLVTKSAALRRALFFYYESWAQAQAAGLFRRYAHPLAEWQDYVSLASQALLQAIDRFDPTRQPYFRAFAAPYIKGTILRGLSCYVSDQRAHVEVGEPNQCEQRLDVLANKSVGLAFTYFLTMGICEQSPVDNNPLSLCCEMSSSQQLQMGLARLPTRERQILLYHYYQQMSFVDISRLLGVHKSRVSQLHQQALRHLRAVFIF